MWKLDKNIIIKQLGTTTFGMNIFSNYDLRSRVVGIFIKYLSEFVVENY